ncbi:DNA-binding response regulator [Insulibacter thermoxylanivorax]|uniref:DNA-binding response regulator n=1 Tax=Insulibacter thermoxylanivorax TaxID=2749268 RepID=A0A916VHT3_9BACL|nr:response regulator transcription factor [Insulibacter thermoxylanivorax]GFR38600.1 DNA-binding response regulator [Insulibacter thermoxylanivorax]
MRQHILVVDDDEKITSMLRRSLTFEGYEVTIANNGQDALRLLMEREPHLIILDVMMPYLDGWEVCRRLREGGCKVPILMLTAKDEVKDRVKGLDIGADDYLVKPFALEELLARVRALLRRYEEADESHELTFDDLRMDVDAREVYRNGQRIDLTTREFDLLHLFMMNPRKVLAKDIIMERIWGYDYSGESNVLEVYIAMLRQKLEEHGAKRLIHTVRGAGYVLRGDD